jgi:hypothetical protein
VNVWPFEMITAVLMRSSISAKLSCAQKTTTKQHRSECGDRELYSPKLGKFKGRQNLVTNYKRMLIPVLKLFSVRGIKNRSRKSRTGP